MKAAVAIGILVAFAVVWVVNCSLMLFSPRSWLRPPAWISWMVVSNLSDWKRHRTGWGLIETRILGAVMLSAFIWMICDAIFGHH